MDNSIIRRDDFINIYASTSSGERKFIKTMLNLDDSSEDTGNTNPHHDNIGDLFRELKDSLDGLRSAFKFYNHEKDRDNGIIVPAISRMIQNSVSELNSLEYAVQNAVGNL